MKGETRTLFFILVLGHCPGESSEGPKVGPLGVTSLDSPGKLFQQKGLQRLAKMLRGGRNWISELQVFLRCHGNLTGWSLQNVHGP